PSDLGWGRERQPVINVSWEDIKNEYLPWLESKTGKPYRLLSEAEWEYVARAGSVTKYAWGDDISLNSANCKGCGSPWDGRQPAPIGSFRANAFGAHDMHGNVWEWVEDCYREDYKVVPVASSSMTSNMCDQRSIRGGSWKSGTEGVRAASRSGVPPGT